jgi:hypothetical protein
MPTMAEDWTTAEGLREIARVRAGELPGWQAPMAFAVGYLADGDWVFPHVNRSGLGLTAVVLAETVGHRCGTREYRLTPDELAAAIRGLQPAEAATALQHPNLAAWRIVADVQSDDIVAVFVGDLGDPPAGAADAVLRGLL